MTKLASLQIGAGCSSIEGKEGVLKKYSRIRRLQVSGGSLYTLNHYSSL